MKICHVDSNTAFNMFFIRLLHCTHKQTDKMKKKLIEIPEELFKQIEESAKKNVRSVNKEIVFLLQYATDNT